MITEELKKALNDNMWFITTCGEDGPHAVPVGFKCVTDDGKLAFAVCCLEKTMKNYQANGQLVISVCAGAAGSGFSIPRQAAAGKLLSRKGAFFSLFFREAAALLTVESADLREKTALSGGFFILL